MSVMLKDSLEVFHESEPEEDYYDYAADGYPANTGTHFLTFNSTSPIRMPRKQQLEQLNRDDHVTVVPSTAYLEDINQKQMEVFPTTETIKKRRHHKLKMYQLNPDDFPEDIFKQQQIRRAQMTHGHRERSRYQIRELKAENQRMKQELVMCQERERRFLESCECGAAKTMNGCASEISKFSSSIKLSSENSNSSLQKNENILLSNSIQSPSCSSTTSKADLSKALKVTIKGTRRSAMKENELPMPPVSPNSLKAQDDQPKCPIPTSSTSKAPTKWFMIQKTKEGKNRLVKLDSPLNSPIPSPLPSHEKLPPSKKARLPLAEEPTKFLETNKSPQKETEPAKLLENTLYWMENFSKNLKRSGKLSNKVLEIEPSEEMLQYWSNDVLPLSFCSKEEISDSSLESYDIEAEEVFSRLTRAQKEAKNLRTNSGREKRAVTKSRLSTNDLLQKGPSRKRKLQKITPQKKKPNEDEEIDWENCELQYLRPRTIYSMDLTN